MRIRRRRHRVRWAFSAGKHNVPAAQTARFLARLAKQYRLQLILTTESQSPGIRAEVAAALGPAWTVFHEGEYLCAWRRDTFARRGATPADVRRFSDVDGLPDWQNVFAGIFRLTHLAARRPFLLGAFHANSGIEYGADFRPGTKLKQISSRTGLTGVGKFFGRRVRAARRTVALVAGDLNLTQLLERWLKYAEETLGGTSIWRQVARRIGDHGRRLIVTAHSYGRGVTFAGGRIIPETEIDYPTGYDHLVLVGAIEFPGAA